MRLIDADALIQDMESVCNRSQFGRATAKMCINRAPSIEFPVVQCDECIYKDAMYCPAFDSPMERTSFRIGFCNLGNRGELE